MHDTDGLLDYKQDLVLRQYSHIGLHQLNFSTGIKINQMKIKFHTTEL